MLPSREQPGLERVPLMSEPMAVALPVSHPLAAGPVLVADLADEQWIVGRDGSSFLDVQVRVANEAEGELGNELGDTGMTVDVDGAALGWVDATHPPMSKANNATVMLRAAGCRGFLMFFQTTERPRTFDLRRWIRTGPFQRR